LCWLALIRIAETTTGTTWAKLADELDLLTLGTFTGPAGTFRQTAELTKTPAIPTRVGTVADGHPQGDGTQRDRQGGCHARRGETPCPARSLLPAACPETQEPGTSARQRAHGACLSRTHGNWRAGCGGNLQAMFGKRPTEKDPAKRTSPAVDFTLRGAGRSNAPGLPGLAAARVTGPRNG